MGAFATFLLTALKGKGQVWVLLIPETVTDEKQHEMAGQLCRSQSGTLAKIIETWGRNCFNQKKQRDFGLFFVCLFCSCFICFGNLEATVNQNGKRKLTLLQPVFFFFFMWPCTHFFRQWRVVGSYPSSASCVA